MESGGSMSAAASPPTKSQIVELKNGSKLIVTATEITRKDGYNFLIVALLLAKPLTPIPGTQSYNEFLNQHEHGKKNEIVV